MAILHEASGDFLAWTCTVKFTLTSAEDYLHYPYSA